MYGISPSLIHCNATYETSRLLFTTTLATAVLAYGIIEWSSKEKDESLARSPQPWIGLGGAAALIALGLFGSSLNVGCLVILVAAILLAQVVLDVSTRLQHPEPEIVGVTSGG
jgi:hypothetical protein